MVAKHSLRPPLPRTSSSRRFRSNKIRLQESLADVDFSDFHPALKSVRRVGGMETDRDGLIDLRATGVQIAVSPELIARAVVLVTRF